jgi:hypothetical protein
MLVDHITAGKEWRCATISESYRWLRDRELIALEKVAPDRYRLDAHRLRFSHHMELALPEGTTADEHAYHARSFER